jgi:hypothetical protein
LKWAVVDKFKDYLYQQDFTVYTDNNPVTYVLTSAKLDATGHRWLASLRISGSKYCALFQSTKLPIPLPLGSKSSNITSGVNFKLVLTSAKLDATGHRWLASLAAFHFDIRYRPGRNNANADALSRLPQEFSLVCRIIALCFAKSTTCIADDSLRSICS